MKSLGRYLLACTLHNDPAAAVRRFEVLGTLERATNALLCPNDMEVELGWETQK